MGGFGLLWAAVRHFLGVFWGCFRGVLGGFGSLGPSRSKLFFLGGWGGVPGGVA